MVHRRGAASRSRPACTRPLASLAPLHLPIRSATNQPVPQLQRCYPSMSSIQQEANELKSLETRSKCFSFSSSRRAGMGRARSAAKDATRRAEADFCTSTHLVNFITSFPFWPHFRDKIF